MKFIYLEKRFIFSGYNYQHLKISLDYIRMKDEYIFKNNVGMGIDNL